jgi:hypothetical protein
MQRLDASVAIVTGAARGMGCADATGSGDTLIEHNRRPVIAAGHADVFARDLVPALLR